MKLPKNDHDIEKHERENYPITGNGIAPRWIKSEKGLAQRDQKQWLDNMTDEQLEQHRKNEQYFQIRKQNDYHY